MTTVGAIWRDIQARLFATREVAPSEGKQLVKAVLEFDDNALILHDNTPFPAERLAALEAMVLRRLEGEPLAYILGFAWFYGRRWKVTPGVLIPRPDTEVLVEACLAVIPTKNIHDFRILEIGVGSGCLGGTLLAERPGVAYTGVELSERAWAVAVENIQPYGAADVRLGDGFERLEGTFNLLVSNPPYVTDEEWENLENEVKDFEPRLALTGGEPNGDGLVFYRRLIMGAHKHLAPRGWLCVEVGWQQAPAVRKLLQQEGAAWDEISVLKDLGGRERVVCARLR